MTIDDIQSVATTVPGVTGVVVTPGENYRAEIEIEADSLDAYNQAIADVEYWRPAGLVYEYVPAGRALDEKLEAIELENAIDWRPVEATPEDHYAA